MHATLRRPRGAHAARVARAPAPHAAPQHERVALQRRVGPL